MFLQRRQDTICFAKIFQKPKKEFLGVPVSKANAIIWKEWKKVKASEKLMKKYKELYEEEKQRHEEALQRYQGDDADEMEIINFTKSVTRRIGRFYSLKHYPNQGSSMIQARKNRSLKKHPVM